MMGISQEYLFPELCTLKDNMYGLYSDFFLEKLINRLEILIEIQ